jgi:superfamily II DNA or RNA helicase
MPTGGGKTVVFSDIIRENVGASCAIAHRQELVSQISIALARNGIRHRIIGSKEVVRVIVKLHTDELGSSFYDPSAACAVASVDTLVLRNGTGKDGDFYYQTIDDKVLKFGPRVNGRWPRLGVVVPQVPTGALSGLKPPRDIDANLVAWFNSVTLWVMDEAHHVLKENKWGTAVSMLPNAWGLGVTATAGRADGKGLGRHTDGVFDSIVLGPPPRELINSGYLTDYRVIAPGSDIDLSEVTVSKTTGDYSPAKLKKAVRKSRIIGDVVKHYLKWAPGKLGVTFASDVETATDIAAGFNAAGVPAEIVSAKTPAVERTAIIRRFKNRELLQLVNVDLFGEGFDLPAIEVVSMARPTQSYSLYVQQFGRALRIMISPELMARWDSYTDEQRLAFIAASYKHIAIIIDHVGNVDHHKLPDKPRIWSLDRRDKRAKSAPSDVIPVRTCGNPKCASVYERTHSICPYCGHRPEPAGRSSPEQVDGDLIELDAATLANMRGEVAQVDLDPAKYRAQLAAKYMPYPGQVANVKRHVIRQEAQAGLRASIAWWAGLQRAKNRPDSESYKRFFFKFGIDVLSAQALNTREALTLAERINIELGRMEE